ncbi:MAG: phrA [Hyphomicrobiales bacterium]|nr:phrA [Hyphomicrobiales bacterium]
MSKNSKNEPVIVWFRDDLRLSDQPAVSAAVSADVPVLCLYVFDEESPAIRPLGGASRWWLHHSLATLGASLEKLGGRLDILRGPGAETLATVATASRASGVFWTRRYGSAEIEIDRRAKSGLSDAGVAVRSFNGQLLREPWEVQTKAGTFFRVFTPFWRALRALPDPTRPLPAPKSIEPAAWPDGAPQRVDLESLNLLPKKPDWSTGLRETWTPGEHGAMQQLGMFLDERVSRYAGHRDRPDVAATSALSPFLRFGEISPRQIFHAVRHAEQAGSAPARDAEKFLTEIGWREFSYHLLYYVPDLARANFQRKFEAFPWREPEPEALDAWKHGRTGYPLVDAGMRELWQTGIMHNRVRMIVASFLVKDLLVDWRVGEEWFWNTLCDADPASNPASWQWVAGSGADAAPYFRVFNPTLQAKKFDPSGVYVRSFVKELAGLPDTWIHEPWLAPADVLRRAGVMLDGNYPRPIIDHSRARDRALAALSSTKTDTA